MPPTTHAGTTRLSLALGALALVACNTYEGSAAATIATFVPEGHPIHEEHRATFDFEGREVALTHVEYGELMDCSAGCFSSTVCAIEDGEDVLLFYASWHADDETPIGVEEECPELDRDETWPRCEPSGLTHPVTETSAFREFARDQIGSGPLRACVNRYGDRF